MKMKVVNTQMQLGQDARDDCNTSILQTGYETGDYELLDIVLGSILNRQTLGKSAVSTVAVRHYDIWIPEVLA